jgi:hypothetical protein
MRVDFIKVSPECYGIDKIRYYAAFSACSCAVSANETITDVLFSLLAIATFARMMIVWTELNTDPTFATIQPWLPVVAWTLAAGLLLMIAFRRGEGEVLQRV